MKTLKVLLATTAATISVLSISGQKASALGLTLGSSQPTATVSTTIGATSTQPTATVSTTIGATSTQPTRRK